MKTTINNRGCPIPGTSQQKEPVRLIDASNVMEAVFCAVELYNSEYLAIQHEIEKIPTIDPESLRPTAHWISDSGGSANVVCSACNAISFAAYNFCPECGAKMVSAYDRLPLPNPPEVTP